MNQILFKLSSTHNILPHGSYFLVLRVIETIFAPATPGKPNKAAGTSQSTNFRLTQGQITLKKAHGNGVLTESVRSYVRDWARSY